MFSGFVLDREAAFNVGLDAHVSLESLCLSADCGAKHYNVLYRQQEITSAYKVCYHGPALSEHTPTAACVLRFHSLPLPFICLSPNKHGVITTEEEQYLIEPLKNVSSTTSNGWNLEEAQQHVIYKMSAIPSPQEQSQEFSCGISGW